MGNSRTTRWLVLAVASIVAVVAFMAAAQNCSEPPATAESTTVSIKAVSALGRLEPASRVLQIAPASGSEGAKISQLLVGEGDEVVAGQAIAVLDIHDRRAAAVAVAESEAAAARARLVQVRAGAKAGDIQAKRAELQRIDAKRGYYQTLHRRGLQLANTNAIAEEELDQRRWNFDSAVLDQQRVAAELESLAEVREVDVALAEREVEVAQAIVGQRRAELATSEIVAPISGTILKVYARVGERVGDQGLLALADTQHMQAVAEVFEADLDRVQRGNPAEVRVASSGKVLRGTVAEVGRLVARKDVLSNDPISDIDARVVEVRIDLQLDADSVARRLSNARIEAIIRVDRPPATQVAAVDAVAGFEP